MTRSVTTMKSSTAVLRQQMSESMKTNSRSKAVVLPVSLPGSSRDQNSPPRNDNRMKLVVTARMGGKLASSQEQLSDITSSYLASDELNTPEPGLNSPFRFGTMPQLETSGSLLANTDLMEVDNWEDNMSPILINNNVGSFIVDDILAWPLDSSTQQQQQQQVPELKRPAELKLKLHATSTSLHTPNLSTPNMSLDTPDVLQQLDNFSEFNLLAYVNGKSENPALDSPLFSHCFPKMSTKSATTIKREQTFIEDEEEISPVTIEVPIVIADNNSQDILITDQIQNNSFDIFNVKTETEGEQFVIPETPFSPPQNEICIESTSSEIIVPEVITTRKRSSRLISNESKKDYKDDSNSDSEEASCSYKRSRGSSISSRSSYFPGKRAIKMEEEDDVSSLTGSAAEYKYSQLRHRNNEASRRSRLNRKSKESEMEEKAAKLTSENRRLHSKVDRLDHLVTTIRKALLESIKKANNK